MTQTSIPALRLLLACCACGLLLGCGIDRPNVLVIVLDDFGYNDLGLHSELNGIPQRLDTPHLDAFARSAARFTRHYSESTCSPSRAALLTGRYPARAGFTSSGRGIAPETVTLAERLLDSGYRTHFVGKWHTGDTTDLAAPHNQGFETWLGFRNQWRLEQRFDPAENNLARPTYTNPWLENENGELRQYQGHLNDLLTSEAKRYIQNSHEQDPWFLQLSYYAPHEPVVAAERFRSRYPEGPEGDYRALVNQLDHNIGQLLASVDDNTLVVIVSDNGGTTTRFPSNLPYAGVKAIPYEEGTVRTPLMIRFLDQDLNQRSYDFPVSTMDLNPTIQAALGLASDLSDIDGINLLPALYNSEPPRRQLFWELLAGEEYAFSVLDADGRFRYSVGLFQSEQLFDLAADPYGRDNVISRYPDVSAKMKADYLQWHDRVHRVDASFDQLDDNGAGIVSGDSMQRSPGFGGFTFAIGVRPAPNTGKRQVIASQAELLDISTSSETLEVWLQDARLTGILTADGQCHSIIVSGNQNARISTLNAGEPILSPMALYVDGVLQESIVDRRELPKEADLTAPTYIGFSPDQKDSAFQGQLSQPIILNQQLHAEPGPGQFGLEGLHQQLCEALP